MTRYETTILLYRKSDRQLIQIHVNKPVYIVRENYIKAALGDKQFDTGTGKWSIDLNKCLVLSIEQTMISITEDVSERNIGKLMRVIKRKIGRKRPSSAGHKKQNN